MSRARKTAIVEFAAMSESRPNPETRGNRAMALMCAAVCWRGDPTDSEGMLGVADEFLQYIEGDDAMFPRPYADKPVKGRMPKP